MLLSTRSSARAVALAVLAALGMLGTQLAVTAAHAAGAVPMCGGKRATIVGTAGADSIRGTRRADVIVGRGGSDVIDGRGGNDLICGNGGDDRLSGGAGADRLGGGPGNDRMYGGDGRDVVSRQEGHDVLRGGAGKDAIAGGDGRDSCASPGRAAGATSCEPPCVPNTSVGVFRVGERAANSWDAQMTTPVCFVESDFRFTGDGTLVGAHDDGLGGTCGSVSHSTLAQLRRCRLSDGSRVATLDDFLRVPLSEWYIDLKSNALAESDAAAMASVRAAVAAIKRTGRERGAILMLYKVTPEVALYVRQNGIRAAMKGYPDSRAAAEAMVDTAALYGFEMVCIRITWVDQQMLNYSNALGVWHLTWELGDKEPQEWKRLADGGLKGLIVSRPRIPLARDAIFGA